MELQKPHNLIIVKRYHTEIKPEYIEVGTSFFLIFTTISYHSHHQNFLGTKQKQVRIILFTDSFQKDKPLEKLQKNLGCQPTPPLHRTIIYSIFLKNFNSII